MVLFIFSAVPKGAYADHWKDLGAFHLTGTVAPNFTLQSLDGEPITLNDLKGKVILLNFWATWCHPCIEEMASIERIYRKYQDKGFIVLGIDIMEKPEKVKKYVMENNITFPILLDTKGEVKRKYRVSGIPSTYLVNKAGMLIAKVLGEREWDNDTVCSILDELIGE